MTKEQVVQKIYEKKITAIVREIPEEYLFDLADAFYAGGIEIIEIPFNNSRPESFRDTSSAIRKLKEYTKDRMVVGAGTVLTVEQADMVYEAGGQIIVTPNTEPAVVSRAKELGLVTMIGALTPTEIQNAGQAGADFVKIFPSGNLGPAYIKAVRAPLKHIPMIAVGGVNENNLKDFYAAGCIGAGIGGNLCNMDWIKSGDFHKITEHAKKFVTI